MFWITHLEGGPRRVNHAAVAVGHKIYSFGGYCTGDNIRNYSSMDVHVLNTFTLRWTKHPVSELNYFENDDILPYKRYGHTAVSYDGNFYIWGGRNDTQSCAVLFKFDPTWHCWTAPNTRGDIPIARDGHTACVWKNRMYVFGGYEDEMDSFAKTVYMLDLDTLIWSYIQTIGKEPDYRDFHSAVCIDDKMYIFGGRGTRVTRNTRIEEVYSNELWYLNLLNNEWVKVEINGPNPIGRRSHSAFVYNNKMYIFGGYNGLLGEHFNDLHEFDPATCSWRKVVCSGEPPCRRRRQACVLVKNKVFLFGGTSPVHHSRDQDSQEDKLVDLGDMHVLDLAPSLKTLCLLAIRRHKLDTSIVPASLKIEYDNMFMDNKISMNRPSNWAG